MIIFLFLHSLGIAFGSRADLKGVIHSEIGYNYGDWQTEVFCPSGTYIIGFQTKMSCSYYGTINTKVFCSNPIGGSISSILSFDDSATTWADYGVWSAQKLCSPTSNNFVIGYVFQSDCCGYYDDLAVNDMNFFCANGMVVNTLDGCNFGTWTSNSYCSVGSAACGFVLQFYPDAGIVDDLAVTDMKMYCCTICKTDNGFYWSSNNKCNFCHRSCKTCQGPLETDCLSCFPSDNLVDGKCMHPEMFSYLEIVQALDNNSFINQNLIEYGWISNVASFVYDCNEWHIAGRFASGDYLEVNLISLFPHYKARVKFRFFKIDDWNLKNGLLFIDNVQQSIVEIQALSSDQDPLYFGNQCGGTKPEDSIFVDYIFAHVSSSVNIRFTSNLDSDSSVHSWGIRDISVGLFKCDTSCLTCSGPNSNECTSCYNGMTPTISNKCDCGTNQYFYSNFLECQETCETTVAICVEICLAPSYGDPLTRKCVNDCPSGLFKYDPDRLCYKSCPGQYYANLITKKCESPCPDNMYGDLSTKTCKFCDLNCKTCTGPSSSDCLSCKYGDLSLKQCILPESFLLVENQFIGTFTNNMIENSGWSVQKNFSQTHVYDCGNEYRVFGGYGDFGKQTSISKIYSNLPGHDRVRVAFFILKIDDWNYNKIIMYIDSIPILYQVFESTFDIDICGNSSFPDAIRPIDIYLSHTTSSINITISSNLTKIADNSSWGIFDFKLYINQCFDKCVNENNNNIEQICIEGYYKTVDLQCVLQKKISFQLIEDQNNPLLYFLVFEKYDNILFDSFSFQITISNLNSQNFSTAISQNSTKNIYFINLILYSSVSSNDNMTITINYAKDLEYKLSYDTASSFLKEYHYCPIGYTYNSGKNNCEKYIYVTPSLEYTLSSEIIALKFNNENFGDVYETIKNYSYLSIENLSPSNYSYNISRSSSNLNIFNINFKFNQAVTGGPKLSFSILMPANFQYSNNSVFQLTTAFLSIKMRDVYVLDQKTKVLIENIASSQKTLDDAAGQAATASNAIAPGLSFNARNVIFVNSFRFLRFLQIDFPPNVVQMFGNHKPNNNIIKIEEKLEDKNLLPTVYQNYNISPYILNNNGSDLVQTLINLFAAIVVFLIFKLETVSKNKDLQKIFPVFVWNLPISNLFSNYMSYIFHTFIGLRWYALHTQLGLINFIVSILFLVLSIFLPVLLIIHMKKMNEFLPAEDFNFVEFFKNKDKNIKKNKKKTNHKSLNQISPQKETSPQNEISPQLGLETMLSPQTMVNSIPSPQLHSSQNLKTLKSENSESNSEKKDINIMDNFLPKTFKKNQTLQKIASNPVIHVEMTPKPTNIEPQKEKVDNKNHKSMKHQSQILFSVNKEEMFLSRKDKFNCQKEKFVFLHKDYKHENWFQSYYLFVDLIRHMIIGFIVVWIYQLPIIALAIVNLINFIFLFFFIAFLPFKKAIDNIQNLLNELCLNMACYSAFMLTLMELQNDTDLDMKMSYGWAIIAANICLIATSLARFAYIGMKSLYEVIKNLIIAAKKKYQLRKKNKVVAI